MRVAKSLTIDLELLNKVVTEANATNRSFSEMVEYILYSHYTEKDRPTSELQ